MFRSVVTAGIWLAFASASSAMDLQQMQLANGLSEIMSKAEPCGYAIDDAALEAYFTEHGLATPEILSFISSNVAVGEFAGSPTAADCTLAKTTARSIGILAQ